MAAERAVKTEALDVAFGVRTTAVTMDEPAVAVTCTSDVLTAAVAAIESAIDCSMAEVRREMS